MLFSGLVLRIVMSNGIGILPEEIIELGGVKGGIAGNMKEATNQSINLTIY
jgi:hypothetical protein